MRAIVERAYLVDPTRTDQDLRALGEHRVAAELRVDYESGRLVENHGTLTGRRVVVERSDTSPPRQMLGGALVTSTAPQSGQ